MQTDFTAVTYPSTILTCMLLISCCPLCRLQTGISRTEVGHPLKFGEIVSCIEIHPSIRKQLCTPLQSFDQKTRVCSAGCVCGLELSRGPDLDFGISENKQVDSYPLYSTITIICNFLCQSAFSRVQISSYSFSVHSVEPPDAAFVSFSQFAPSSVFQ